MSRSALPALLGLIAFLHLSTPTAAQVDCGIFVAPVGSDTSDCGLLPGDPCRTINHAITRAAVEGTACVFIGAGIYVENVVLDDGIDIVGGYDVDWEYDVYSAPGHRSEIRGGYDDITDRWWTVRADQISQITRLRNLVLVGPNATGDLGSAGRSTYVIHADNADLVLEQVRLEAGNATDGFAGSDGTSASQIVSSTMHGKKGGNAREFISDCNTTRQNGGVAGVNPSAAGSNGGVGGKGGQMDTCCTLNTCALCNCNATSGLSGNNGQNSGGGFGGAGGGGSPCNAGTAGQNGRVVNGDGGAGGIGGSVQAGFWSGNSGLNGSLGMHGGGGGGGGGSGGCDTGTDSYGAGGGGGGAGGVRGNPGNGGYAGGSSFGLFSVDSTIDLIACDIIRGSAGDGGTGGTGGAGQPGGNGGAGGNADGDSHAGRNGGHGGHGGHGGGGGGGAGGSSIGIYASGSTITTNGVTYASGSAGQGGTGGDSGPGWLDGNPGTDGASGTVDTVFQTKSSQVLAGASHRSKAICSVEPCLATDAPAGAATRFFFSQATPNPTGDQTVFQLGLSTPSQVRLELYTVSGRRVRVAVDRELPAGTHPLRMQVSDLASGVYYARLRTDARLETRKLMIVR